MSTSLTSAPRLRLEFLDGLRGLAALYVVLFHAFQTTTQVTASDTPTLDAALIWRIGHPAVSVFIVLSGFCLMLPVVRAGGGTLRGGVRDYLARRARRILPPYYAALLLSALFLAAAHFARYHSRPSLHDKVLALHLSPGSLLSHVFLVHNLNSIWVETIDVPMWSVATEW
ncbi:MAG: acyltransferase family protein, partial [Armatimonadota bacterium]|nr:acyltransferase family protein [Armatimonadota bacterium]